MKFYKITASGLGTGYSPVAPGTAGAVLGIILLWIFNFALQRLNIGQPIILAFNFGAVILVMLIGVKSIKEVHKIWKHDAGKIVIDEIVGVWIAAFAIPFEWEYYLSALILFRFFDIAKPLYIKKFDNMKTNWSVMLDDVLAGIYSLVVLQLIIYFKVF